MRLSELKALVDKATAQCEKHRCGDPLVVTIDFRGRQERQNQIGHCEEEMRHAVEAELIEPRSLMHSCSDLHYYNHEGLFANIPVFYITADDTRAIL